MLIDETNIDHAIERLKNKAAQKTVHKAAVKPAGLASADHQVVDRRRTLGMPDWLAGSVNSGGLPRGAVTAMSNCPAVVVDMLAQVTADGGCAAVVGYPNLALAAVAAAGGDLARLIIISDPQPHAAAVLSTVAEGVDMIVYVPVNSVSPTFARPIEARLRKSNCALVCCGEPWPSARLNIDIRVSGVGGLGWGSGRVRTIDVQGRLWGKGQPPSWITGTLIGQRRRTSAAEQFERTVGGDHVRQAVQ